MAQATLRRFAAALLLCAMVGCSSAGPSCPAPPAHTEGRAPYNQVWIATRTNVDSIEAIAPTTTDPFFNVADSYVVEHWEVWPWASASVRTAYWPSAQTFAADVAEHREALASVEAAVFDPELWAATPASEQQDPGSAMSSFAETAHELGVRVVITPGLSIAKAPGQSWCPPPTSGESSEESAEDAYLRCNVAGLAARYADVVEIQGQELQDDPEAYESFVTKAAAQARAANPDVVVLAGLRTRSAVDVDAVRASWASVLEKVDGHYLAMDPEHAGELLTWIDECSREASA